MKIIDLSSYLESQFLDTLREFNLIKSGDKIIVAFSGGPDSVFLTVLFNKYREKLEITLLPVHINHNLRGHDSSEDEAFCKGLGASMGLECLIRDIYPAAYARNNRLSIETAARELRYKELEAVLKETGSNKIAAGHHLDDLVETMLFRLFKGTGISGLAAMVPSRGNIIRPILFFKRSDILAYLDEHKISFRKDLSNQSLIYDRNYIRNRIIPDIKSRFPDFSEKMLTLYRIIIDEESLWKNSLENLKESYTIGSSVVIIDKNKLPRNTGYSNALIRRLFRLLLKDFTQNKFHPDYMLITRMLEYSKSEYGNRILYDNGRLRIISSYDKLIIDEGMKKFPKSAKYVKLNGNSRVRYGIYRLTFERLKHDLLAIDKKSTPTTCLIGSDELKTIIVRSRHEGDSFRLSGTGKKKIKDFFIDCKFSLSQREGSFLLESEKGRIIAVYVPDYGFRVSSDFYISKKTKKVLRVSVLTL
jgi:tRNA(Ile)-lysidine synthase